MQLKLKCSLKKKTAGITIGNDEGKNYKNVYTLYIIWMLNRKSLAHITKVPSSDPEIAILHSLVKFIQVLCHLIKGIFRLNKIKMLHLNITEAKYLPSFIFLKIFLSK